MVAPSVPEALEPDNLLHVTTLESGMTVSIPEWPRVLPDDKLEVHWKGNIVHTFDVVDPQDVVFPYTFIVSPNDLKGDGVFPLFYSVTASSGASDDSDQTFVKIDTSSPNLGNVPEALIFPDDVLSNGLTSEYLEENDDQVIAVVPQYAGMEAGQTVHPSFYNRQLDSVVVTETDVTNGQVPIIIPGETVREVGEGEQISTYFLTSRAGFDGLRSAPASVNVLLSPVPADLLPAHVPLADDGLIDIPDANLGVLVEIEEYKNASSSDIIWVKWGNQQLQPTAVIPGGFPITIPVLRSTIIQAGSGEITVSYHITRSNMNFLAPDEVVQVDVTTVGPVDPNPGTPENEALEPPVVVGFSATENELIPEDYDNPVQVTIPFYEEAQVGEKIKVYWGHAPATLAVSYTVSESDITSQVFAPLEVAAEIVNTTPNDAAFPVSYTIGRATGTENAVSSPAQFVNVHMSRPGGVEGLDPAVFTETNAQGWLLKEQIEDGTEVLVNVYENMAIGDIVTLNWMAFSTTNAAPGTEIEGSEYSDFVTVSEPELANGITFNVPKEFIDPIAEVSPTYQGAGQVFYTVTQGGSDTTSSEEVVKIDLI